MAGPNHLLRNARLAKGIPLRRFAKMLDVSVSTLYRWEMGLQDPYPIHKQKLTIIFEKSLPELGLTINGDMSSEQESAGGDHPVFGLRYQQ